MADDPREWTTGEAAAFAAGRRAALREAAEVCAKEAARTLALPEFRVGAATCAQRLAKLAEEGP